jgi:pyrimidine-nucleoside phosphorylase
VIDLKVGSGAFMATYKHAQELAKSLIRTGHAFGQKVTVVFTNMNSPLGTHIGNALEVIEAIDYLKGKYLPDTQLITEILVSEMLVSSGKADSISDAVSQIRNVIQDGTALSKFQEMITAQDGDAGVCENYQKFASARYQIPVLALHDGFVESIDSRNIGYALIGVKAGRMTVQDTLDYGAGAVLYPKVGDQINAGSTIGHIYANNELEGKTAADRVLSSYKLSPQPVPHEEIILGRMTIRDIDQV